MNELAIAFPVDEFATAARLGERGTIIDVSAPLPSLKDGFPSSFLMSTHMRVSEALGSRDYESTRQGAQPETARNEVSPPPGKGLPTLVELKPQAVDGGVQKALLQKWEGTVRNVSGNDFVADIVDLTNPSNPREEVVLAVDEVSPDDLSLLEPGAVFYWSIFYETSHGQRTRVSRIRFRRWPPWTRRELEAIEQEATALMGQLSQPDAQSACG
jgi:hypothetical protein